MAITVHDHREAGQHAALREQPCARAPSPSPPLTHTASPAAHLMPPVPLPKHAHPSPSPYASNPCQCPATIQRSEEHNLPHTTRRVLFSLSPPSVAGMQGLTDRRPRPRPALPPGTPSPAPPCPPCRWTWRTSTRCTTARRGCWTRGRRTTCGSTTQVGAGVGCGVGCSRSGGMAGPRAATCGVKGSVNQRCMHRCIRGRVRFAAQLPAVGTMSLMVTPQYSTVQ